MSVQKPFDLAESCVEAPLGVVDLYLFDYDKGDRVVWSHILR